jgi:hypothetical protein
MLCRPFYSLYRFRLDRNYLTAENTEDTEGENRDFNNSDATGFDITRLQAGNAEREALPTFPSSPARQSKSDMGSQAGAWEPVNIFVGGKHDRSKSLAIVNKLPGVMLRPSESEMHRFQRYTTK